VKVPGKVCFPYVTGHRKGGNKKFRPKRVKKNFFDFLLAVYRGKVQMKGYHIEPAPAGEAEAYAKKAMSLIKGRGRGLGEMEISCIADEYDEWWRGQFKIDREKKRLVRAKGEKHRRARKNWRKALATIEEKARLQKQREKQIQRENKRVERERIDRAWENLKSRAAVTTRPYI
jgi:hypothetical protein